MIFVIEPAVLRTVICSSLAVMICCCRYCVLFYYVIMCGIYTWIL